jgi:hypothetical protein
LGKDIGEPSLRLDIIHRSGATLRDGISHVKRRDLSLLPERVWFTNSFIKTVSNSCFGNGLREHDPVRSSAAMSV